MPCSDELKRQLKYHQEQQARKQITALLTAAATWELAAGIAPPPKPARVGAGQARIASQRVQRRGDSGEGKPDSPKCPGQHGPAAQGAFHPRADRRGRKDRRRTGRLRSRDQPDRGSERRKHASRSGASRTARFDGRFAESNHRTEGDRVGPVEARRSRMSPSSRKAPTSKPSIGRPAAKRTTRKRKFPKPSMEARSNRSPERNSADRIHADGMSRSVDRRAFALLTADAS